MTLLSGAPAAGDLRPPSMLALAFVVGSKPDEHRAVRVPVPPGRMGELNMDGGGEDKGPPPMPMHMPLPVTIPPLLLASEE